MNKRFSLSRSIVWGKRIEISGKNKGVSLSPRQPRVGRAQNSDQKKKRERKETLKLFNQNRIMRRCELPSLNLKFNKSSLETQSIDSPSRRKKDFLSKFELIGSVLWTANIYSLADFYRVFSLEFSYVVTTQLNLFFPTCTLRKLSS